jgi:hypothetical protein
LQEEGRLHENIEESGWDSLTNFTPIRPITEIFREQLTALDALYSPSAYLRRALEATLAMRPTRRASSGEKSRPKVAPSRVVAQKNHLRELNVLLRLLWRQGIVSPARLQFWLQLCIVLRKNPSRFKRYLVLCGFGENLFAFVRLLHAQAKNQFRPFPVPNQPLLSEKSKPASATP